jgi:hypothetical protein
MTDVNPEFDAQAEMDFLRDTSAEALLANHFFVLAQWAAVHLAVQPADLVGAQLVIDTMSAMLDSGGQRLGENVALYRTALAEIQQVFVRAAQLGAAPSTNSPEESSNSDHAASSEPEPAGEPAASAEQDED